MAEREAPIESTEPIELSYEVSRDDWMRFNVAYVEVGTEWQVALAESRKRVRASLLYTGVTFIVGGSVLVGLGSSTRGMFLEGAIGGAAIAAVIYFAGMRGNVFGATSLADLKAQTLKQYANADLSAYTGQMILRADERGIEARSADRTVRAMWSVLSLREAGRDLVICGPGDFVMIPARAFGTEGEAAAFRAQVLEWLEAGARPLAARIASYLKGRDVGCVACGYNLRDSTGEKCGECGVSISLDDLIAGKGRRIETRA